ncbi:MULTISPECIES: WD40 domain-containing protein [Nostoc]|uniref:HNH endonuclease n=2 Tax=Nostoc TaxID=1177 RepID=A0ABR8II86_9NOSO|nr:MULTISPECIES: HNH endonuclease [Nostoc]MBD2564285.1 HNH endonuclease [Nostoc linckia FACHB-391]MBD2650531.1 HNH endonuclease [Nostoc foliaceum FACHB-393]
MIENTNEEISFFLESKTLDNEWKCIHSFSYPVGKFGSAYGISFTPNGQFLAGACANDIAIWDLNCGKLKNVLSGHSRTIYSLDTSSNGQIIASASLDNTVKLWNLQTGNLVQTQTFFRKDPIHCVKFSPDGKFIASGGENKYKNLNTKNTSIYLWGQETIKSIDTLSAHSLRINCLIFSPDCRFLVSGSNDKTIKIWDVETKQLIHNLIGHSYNVRCVAITPDGKTVISSGGGGIKFWCITTGKLLFTLSKDLEYVDYFAISPDGKLLASNAGNRKVRVYNLETNQIIHYLEFSNLAAISFSADGKMLAAGCTAPQDDKYSFKVWQVPSDLNENRFWKQDESILDSTIKDVDNSGFFQPENIQDARNYILSSIVRRRGQQAFRKKILAVYNKECTVTGCNAEQALEAAHIYPYKGDDTNEIWNGLILRSDIHTLFDLYLLTIHPETNKVCIAPELQNTSYGELNGKTIRLPKDTTLYPNKEALKWHYKQCKWINDNA